jgi:hypothetical protein
MPVEQRERLATLHDKQQREPLTAEERGEEQALLDLYRETLLVRGQAAILLRQRGYDLSDPEPLTPLACAHVPFRWHRANVWPKQRVFIVDTA